MKQYLELASRVLTEGEMSEDRTGTGTLRLSGHMMRFNMLDGFPLLTTKKLHLPSIIHELLWMLGGFTNVQYLRDNGVCIWNEWADEDGNLGPVYGKQWRMWEQHYWDEAFGGYRVRVIDQISWLVHEIKRRPDSRRLVVSAWNVADLDKMKLHPCHMAFQVMVINGKLNLMVTQRSADVFLGVPFNIAFYAFLLHMLAHQCDLHPGELIWSGGDVHIYQNHIPQLKLQLARDPYPLPTLKFARKPDSIFDYKFEDFLVLDYRAHPSIKGKVAV